MHLLRQFTRRHERDAAVSTAVLCSPCRNVFLEGRADIARHAGQGKLDDIVPLPRPRGPNEFFRRVGILPQRSPAAHDPVGAAAPDHSAGFTCAHQPGECGTIQASLPAIVFANLASVYVDFMFAGIIQKMVPRS